MKVEQIYTACLSEMAYYISDKGEVAIVDPLRDPSPYIRMAEAENAIIKYIFLSHFHADFISGHVDLASKTGATIVYGPGAEANFDFYCGKDNEEFKIGNITLKLLHTPGHTLESSSFLLIDKKGKMPCVFTGDCLFIGDVGRPDLAVKPGSISKEYLAGLLYDSLQNKILPLPDDIIIYPNHSAGSACGKNIGIETFDTLANQKKTNYALSKISKKVFIEKVISGLNIPPQYFPKNAIKNKNINKPIDNIIYEGTTPIEPSVFKELSEQEDFLVIDTRIKEDFITYGSVPGSLYIGAEGDFAYWLGVLITDLNQKIIFITDNETKSPEIVQRFARVGYDNIKGYLFGGITNWINYGYDLDKINSISVLDFSNRLINYKTEIILDVRKESEYNFNHIDGIKNFPLDLIHYNIDILDTDKEYILHCASGYQSLIAASVFKSKGFSKVINVLGKYEMINKMNLL